MSIIRMTIRLLPKNDIKTINMNVNLLKKHNYGLTNMKLEHKRNYTSLNKYYNEMSSQNGVRNISTMEITKYMQLFTEQPYKIEKDPKTLKIESSTYKHKPLVVMLSWLQSRQKHLKKYAELYVNQGFHVLTISVTPWQLLWPVKGTQLVAADILKFLMNNEAYSKLLLHGFSVGGYLWGECMVHMARDMEKYKPLLDKICLQIWDSAADITEIPAGLPAAVFPKNLPLQNALRKYILYHMKTFHEPATSHYIRSSQMFHSTLVMAPALFFFSKTDTIGAAASNLRVIESWESLGIKVTAKCWDRSPHVGHFRKHRDEYLEYLYNHLRGEKVEEKAEILKAKL